MRVARGIAVTVGTALAALAGPLTPAHATAGVNYVALGDSYASGVGSGSYISSSGSCLRSTKSATALWAAANSPASYNSVACSGAKTSDVINNQLSALSSSTSLVSVTVGGNDEGFASIMTDCVLKGTTTCVNEVNAAKADAQANLPAKLDAVYAGIKSRAPGAKVVVLGYPHFYELSSSGCIGLSQASRTAIDGGIDTVDAVTQQAAARAGFVWGDVRTTFAPHEICDGTSWIHSLNWLNVTESYHPTAAGQSGGYLPVLAAKA